jgi:hypothetical protein
MELVYVVLAGAAGVMVGVIFSRSIEAEVRGRLAAVEGDLEKVKTKLLIKL